MVSVIVEAEHATVEVAVVGADVIVVVSIVLVEVVASSEIVGWSSDNVVLCADVVEDVVVVDRISDVALVVTWDVVGVLQVPVVVVVL